MDNIPEEPQSGDEGTVVESHFEDSHLQDLPSPQTHIIRKKCLGDGAYGKVYAANLRSTRQAVALKVVPLDGSQQDEIEVGQEVAVLEKFSRHINIARFFGAYRKRQESDPSLLQDELWLAMELCAFGSAASLILTVRTAPDAWLPETVMLYTMHGLLCGLQYLHSNNVLHRDVKGQNVLYSRDGVVKLCDFGVSATIKATRGKRATVIGTPYWMAPEVIACDYGPGDYGNRCDIWSFGIFSIELAEGVPPLVDVPPMKALLQITTRDAPTLEGSSPTGPWSQEMKDLVNSALVKDHRKRPSATQMLGHRCLTALDLDAAQQELLALLSQLHPEIVEEKDNDWKSSVHIKANKKFKKKEIVPGPLTVSEDESNGTVCRNTDNLASVADLTEDSIIAALHDRLNHDVIYTNIGDILIATNPYKDTGVFDVSIHNRFMPMSPPSSLPHIYSSAQRALKALQTISRNQCCVISGESGAGKTETAKQFVRHTMYMAHGEGENQLESFVLAIEPVLEAFGNAKTSSNENSSRFGKYLQLKFDQNIHVKGAHISHYLLEKSRVPHQGVGERNFHIFYYVQAAAENKNMVPILSECNYLGGRVKRDVDDSLLDRYRAEWREIFPTSPEPGQHPVNKLQKKRSTRGRVAVSQRFKRKETAYDEVDPRFAAQKYVEFIESLKALGFDDEMILSTRRLLAGIMHIGNIGFVEESSGSLRLTAYQSLYTASDMLGIGGVYLGQALCTHATFTRGELISRHYTKEQAQDTRDATAKSLYNRLFNLTVKMINDQGADHHRSILEIGVLDLFGFENFQTNCFEQLCINIANEQLQDYFNDHLFEQERLELKEEGIQVQSEEVSNLNAKPVLDLFFKKKMGAFAILNEESFFPNASPHTLASKLHKQFSKNKLYTAPKSGSAEFVIKHFAEPVKYSLLLFIEKNRDSLSHMVTQLFHNSANKLVQQLYTSDLAEDLAGKTSSYSDHNRRRSKRGNETHRRAQTVAQSFATSLSDLMKKLASCQPHFVRCIKPNADQKPNVFDLELVKRQLRCCGVLATVQQRRDGYPVRLDFVEFVRRYKGIGLKFSENVAHRDAFKACDVILAKAQLNDLRQVILGNAPLNPISSSQTSTVTKSWEVGKTKIFLKYYIVEALATQMQKFHFQAMVIQRNFRQWVARRKVEHLRRSSAALVLQKHVRGWIARKVAALKAESAAAAAAAAAATAAAALKASEAVKAAETAALHAAEVAAEAAVVQGASPTVFAEAEGEDDAVDQGVTNTHILSEMLPGASIDQDDESFDEGTDSPVATLRRAADVTLRRDSSGNHTSNGGKKKSVNFAEGIPPEFESPRSATLRRPSHKVLKEQKRARNADRAKRRAEQRARREARQRELEAVKNRKVDLVLATLNIDEYDGLAQNLVGKESIPQGVAELNRYINILPNPRTRVRLKMVGNDERTRYINANYISSFDGFPRRYIATQGPLPETVRSFWRMVWETNSRAIVMVTGLVERGSKKCARYWPKALYNPELNVGDVNFGDINVRIHAGFRRDGFVTTKFHVKCGDEKREIWHFWFDSWPDHGVPKRYNPVLAMLESCRRWSNQNDHPWIVHCSAGIGRTGAFIAVDHGVRQFQATGFVDVLSIIQVIRNDRGGMVQHPEQAEFVHLCLQTYRDEHGAPIDDDNPVLALSVERALKIVPLSYEGHPSQLNVDEGSEAHVPSWRAQQLEDERDRARGNIADLKLENARKGERMELKEQELERKKQNAADHIAQLVAEMYDDPDDFLITMRRKKVGSQFRSHHRQKSSAPYEFEEISSDSEVSDSEQEENGAMDSTGATENSPTSNAAKGAKSKQAGRNSKDIERGDDDNKSNLCANMSIQKKVGIGAVCALILVIVIIIVVVTL